MEEEAGDVEKWGKVELEANREAKTAASSCGSQTKSRGITNGREIGKAEIGEGGFCEGPKCSPIGGG